MTCSQLVDLLLDHTAGELPPALAVQADAHLEECGNCRAFAATYRAVPDLVEWALSQPDGLDEIARDALGAELTAADQQAIEDALLAELRKRA